MNTNYPQLDGSQRPRASVLGVVDAELASPTLKSQLNISLSCCTVGNIHKKIAQVFQIKGGGKRPRKAVQILSQHTHLNRTTSQTPSHSSILSQDDMARRSPQHCEQGRGSAGSGHGATFPRHLTFSDAKFKLCGSLCQTSIEADILLLERENHTFFTLSTCGPVNQEFWTVLGPEGKFS